MRVTSGGATAAPAMCRTGACVQLRHRRRRIWVESTAAHRRQLLGTQDVRRVAEGSRFVGNPDLRLGARPVQRRLAHLLDLRPGRRQLHLADGPRGRLRGQLALDDVLRAEGAARTSRRHALLTRLSGKLSEASLHCLLLAEPLRLLSLALQGPVADGLHGRGQVEVYMVLGLLAVRLQAVEEPRLARGAAAFEHLRRPALDMPGLRSLEQVRMLLGPAAGGGPAGGPAGRRRHRQRPRLNRVMFRQVLAEGHVGDLHHRLARRLENPPHGRRLRLPLLEVREPERDLWVVAEVRVHLTRLPVLKVCHAVLDIFQPALLLHARERHGNATWA
mmetsp:Transcript_84850/g.274262  ORF Transcript_84850/g.274262 Transcript_84850/m.274262 type:complete len:332 (-) Transcript_84850:1012-2007(-)